MTPPGAGRVVRGRPGAPLPAIAAALCLLVSTLAAQAPRPVEYRLSFPAPQHRWLAVDVRFPDLEDAPLHVRMSSASPGRYARHEFAKNLIEIAFTGAGGAPVRVDRRGSSAAAATTCRAWSRDPTRRPTPRPCSRAWPGTTRSRGTSSPATSTAAR